MDTFRWFPTPYALGPGLYEPFNEVTRKSLLHAVLDHKINLSDALITSICDAYNTLPV